MYNRTIRVIPAAAAGIAAHLAERRVWFTISPNSGDHEWTDFAVQPSDGQVLQDAIDEGSAALDRIHAAAWRVRAGDVFKEQNKTP